MLLAIDIGNSNIVIGIYDNNSWLQHRRIQTVNDRLADEYAVLLAHLFREANLSFSDFTQIIISSVVPQLTHRFKSLITERTHIEPLIVDHTLDTGITLKTNPPDKTGTDLIVNAVAAYHRYQDNCIIVDFGTATTIMAVGKPGELLGGAIAAGLNTTVSAIVSNTAQLPNIEITPPPSIIGNNTIHAMQSGLVVGHLCLVEGLIARIKEELGQAKVIATGGLSNVLGEYTQKFDDVDPWLTLEGLRLISKRY